MLQKAKKNGTERNILHKSLYFQFVCKLWMVMDVAIDVRGLTKRYGDVLAVDHISFKVRDGEMFGFLGPNGAGKTTTIRMLIGILKPDEGSAIVNGFDIVEDPLSVREHMGVVPEVSNAYVDLSAWDNLMFIGELYGIPKSERVDRATRLLKDFGLYDVRDRIVKGFSRGMKQRLLLCMALISDPDIIFLDEPTSGLDVESRRVVWDRIREENANGKTIFLSTHNMDEAQRLCHRIAIINHGRIAAIDTPEGLRAQSMELQCVEIIFNMPVDSKEFLSGGEISKISVSGRKVKIYTADPSSVIEFAVDYAKKRGLRILSLNTLLPSLEDVFLKLVRQHKR